jgi:hypothetical protein
MAITDKQKKTIAEFKEKQSILAKILKLEKDKKALQTKIDNIDSKLAELADLLEGKKTSNQN